MEIFCRKKHFTPAEKIMKSEFAPSEKYSSDTIGLEKLIILCVLVV